MHLIVLNTVVMTAQSEIAKPALAMLEHLGGTYGKISMNINDTTFIPAALAELSTMNYLNLLTLCITAVVIVAIPFLPAIIRAIKGCPKHE